MTNKEIPSLPNKNDNEGSRGVQLKTCKARQIFIGKHKRDGGMRL